MRMLRSLVAVAGIGLALAAASAIPAFAQERVALVIGNGRYIHATALPNPANDAREMARSLREIGFDVSYGEDLDRNDMERLLRDFLNKTRSARIALMFYAGHGLQVDGRNYLVPVDAKLDSPSDLNFGTVELDKILASLDDSSRANIIILDACRDNPLARSFASRTRSAAVGAGLAATTSLGTGTLIAYSTAPGKVAEDGRGANSPFTQGLIKHLRTPGLEVRQMLTRVRAEVASATGDKQVPWDNSSLRGDVYLAGTAPGGVAPPIAAAPRPVPPADCTMAELHWRSAESINSRAAYEDHLARFPNCTFGGLARAKIEALTRVAVAPPSPPPDALSVCPSTFTSFRNNSSELSCTCSAAAATGSVWGANVYTDDSSICAAARHAGVVGDSGGQVRLRGAPGRASYPASVQNGVSSSSWNKWDWSFVFTSPVVVSAGRSGVSICPSNPRNLGTNRTTTCQCRSDQMTGSIWGTGTYTDDSSICLAAVHAGIIGRSGGEVRFVTAPGRSSYAGSSKNGVTTSSYGSWSGSFRFAQ